MSSEKKIIVFCCNWCAYTAADLAGVARMKYPAIVRLIRVMCSGMVHPESVLEAFNLGAAGVMILGCHLGDCHYQDGNYKAMARSEVITDMLEEFGYERERFMITWVSSAEPDRFVQEITMMNERIEAIGSTSGKHGTRKEER
jgi:F420-non-reducing hydrogenase iron-sulfur subunit